MSLRHYSSVKVCIFIIYFVVGAVTFLFHGFVGVEKIIVFISFSYKWTTHVVVGVLGHYPWVFVFVYNVYVLET